MDQGQSEKALALLPQELTESEYVSQDKLKAALEASMAELKEGGGIRSIKFGDVKITGDKATVTFTVTLGNGETSTDTAELVRENGAWKMSPDK